MNAEQISRLLKPEAGYNQKRKDTRGKQLCLVIFWKF